MDHGTEPSGSMPLHSTLEELEEKKNERTLSCAVSVQNGSDKQNPYCVQRAWAVPGRVAQSSHTVHTGVPLCTLSRSTGSNLANGSSKGGTGCKLKWGRVGLSSPPSWLEWQIDPFACSALPHALWDGEVLSLLLQSISTEVILCLPSSNNPYFLSLPTFLSLIQAIQVFSFATNIPQISSLLTKAPQASVPGDAQPSPPPDCIFELPNSVRANPEHTPNSSIYVDLNVLKMLANILTQTLNDHPRMEGLQPPP